MPSINDIAQVAEALEKSPIIVVRDRCVAVRNRNASCRKCVRSCPENALNVQGNELTLTSALCIGCGACVAVCPTEALVSAMPTDGELLSGSASSIKANDGMAVIACARIASKRQADPARFVQVPCLPRVDEVLIVQLAAAGAHSVLLVDGDCKTCKHRACIPLTDAAVMNARELLASQGAECQVLRVTGFPEDMRIQDAAALYGSTRRGFFKSAASQAVETVKVAAKTTIESELGYKLDDASIGERLRVTESGTLPLIRMPRHESAINALDALGQPAVQALDSRLFGTVKVDTQKCNACGMCAVFCPTGALRRDPADKHSDPLLYLEFSAADCVQCVMCVDVCWKGALKLSSKVNTDQLYDFEPRTFQMSSAVRKRKSLFS